MVTTEYVVPGSCSSFGMGPGGRLGAVNRALDSTEKVLHVVNFDLLEKNATCCFWHHGVDFVDCLEGKYGKKCSP